LIGQELPTWDPVILANASAQVLVVSIAEVVVCWALFGAVLRNALGPGVVFAGIAVVSAALVFGVYHFAHSPPFNTPAMVWLLSGVGLATGLFFFLGGDLYSTIVLHNAFAVRGVVQALGESGNLDRYASPQLPLIATAIAAIVVLIIADVVLIRPLVRPHLE
jgi:cytochrome b subunit of formate dehydrogenase